MVDFGPNGSSDASPIVDAPPPRLDFAALMRALDIAAPVVYIGELPSISE
jgi:hypothetical protein